MEESVCDGWTSLTLVEEDMELNIRPLPAKDGILIKVQPPREPKPEFRAPADIVLVIDVSSSMSAEAPAPAEEGQVAERFGLSVLDLVKHASLTILKTLDEGDRLGIVTFNYAAHVLQPLTVMSPAAKDTSAALLKSLRALGNTNMWHGVQEGMELFRTGQDGSGIYRVPSLMLLTDGVPNYMCPQRGWVPKLKSMGSLPAPIHSFGFGYDIKSGLLKSISELSGGHYAFIPDSGMIGTVFIHAVANLQSTMATEACLTIRSNNLGLKSPIGWTVRTGETPHSEKDPNNNGMYSIKISLGRIQFGQSRDLYLAYDIIPTNDSMIEADLTFRDLSGNHRQMTVQRSATDFVQVPAAEVAYHTSRAQLCRFLSALFPIRGPLQEHIHNLDRANDTLPQLKKTIAARGFPDDADCASLMADLEGAPPRGQISLALSRAEYKTRWGGHYLLSLLDAHASQACNTYKDEGPLRYGHDSPLFKRCRDALDSAFDDIEPPQPSIDVLTVPPPKPPSHAPTRTYMTGRAKFRSTSGLERERSTEGFDSLSSYQSVGSCFNRSSNPCFASSTMVKLADGDGVVPISWLRAGMQVATPVGPRAVQAVLKTRVRGEAMVRLPGGVVVTPWHPVKTGSNGAQWAFPAELCSVAAAGQDDQTTLPTTATSTTYNGFTYSLLLEAESSPDGSIEDPAATAEQHAFCVGSGGTWGVALGHGLVEGGDVRSHEFFGDRAACLRALAMLPASGGGVTTSAGVLRSAETGKVVGFRVPDGDDEIRGAGEAGSKLDRVAMGAGQKRCRRLDGVV